MRRALTKSKLGTIFALTSILGLSGPAYSLNDDTGSGQGAINLKPAIRQPVSKEYVTARIPDNLVLVVTYSKDTGKLSLRKLSGEVIEYDFGKSCVQMKKSRKSLKPCWFKIPGSDNDYYPEPCQH